MAKSRLLLVAHRNTETGGQEALTMALAALAHEAGQTRIRLVRLPAADVRRQLESVTGQEVTRNSPPRSAAGPVATRSSAPKWPRCSAMARHTAGRRARHRAGSVKQSARKLFDYAITVPRPLTASRKRHGCNAAITYGLKGAV
jgi:hypothetical protein